MALLADTTSNEAGYDFSAGPPPGSPTAFASPLVNVIPDATGGDVMRVNNQCNAMPSDTEPTKRSRPEPATNASMPSGVKRPRQHPYAFPVIGNIKKVADEGAGKVKEKKRVGKFDSLLMPFLRKIEQSNQELQNANRLGLDTEAMKQLLHKATHNRMQVLEDAQTQLSTMPKAHKQFKRLLEPLAKDVEKVRVTVTVRVGVRIRIEKVSARTKSTSAIAIPRSAHSYLPHTEPFIIS